MTARSYVYVELRDGRRLSGTATTRPRVLRWLVRLSRFSWYPYTVAMYVTYDDDEDGDDEVTERLELQWDVVRHVLVAACDEETR